MGLAILVKGVSFADNNLGTVTRAEAIESLSITNGILVYNTLNKAKLVAVPTPQNVVRDFLWAVDEGSSYASIDQDGVLTVLSGANKSSVTVSVTSLIDPTVSATATFLVSYCNGLTSTGVVGCKLTNGLIATTTNTGIVDTTLREIGTLPQYQLVKLKSTFEFTIAGNLYFAILDNDFNIIKTGSATAANIKTGINITGSDGANAKYIYYALDLWTISGYSGTNVDAVKEIVDNMEFSYLLDTAVDTQNFITYP